MHSPRRSAAAITARRSERSSSPASRVFGCGAVLISSTGSRSSGLTDSPSPNSSRMASIAFASASDSESRIISSSSIPIVKLGPVNFGSIGRVEYEPQRQTDFRTGGRTMALGYDGKLYILAFDHRGPFQKKMFGIEGDPTPEQTDKITDAKALIFEGMAKAVERGLDASSAGVLVDEQFGGDVPQRAREHGLSLTMPVEKSGQDEFDFQYGSDFPAHIEQFDPFASKVLVRFNPDGDSVMNDRQLGRLKELADWLHANGRLFLFELLVPAEDAQLESVGGDTDRYDAELRPELMRRAIEACQDRGIEVDIWKIEGVDTREDAEMLSEQSRKGEGRENVKTVLLGRGASDDKVDHWLRQAAPVEGFVGFAIGRSIWWDALKGFLGGDLERGAAAEQIADNYLRFIQVYDEAEQGAAV